MCIQCIHVSCQPISHVLHRSYQIRRSKTLSFKRNVNISTTPPVRVRGPVPSCNGSFENIVFMMWLLVFSIQSEKLWHQQSTLTSMRRPILIKERLPLWAWRGHCWPQFSELSQDMTTDCCERVHLKIMGYQKPRELWLDKSNISSKFWIPQFWDTTHLHIVNCEKNYE